MDAHDTHPSDTASSEEATEEADAADQSTAASPASLPRGDEAEYSQYEDGRDDDEDDVDDLLDTIAPHDHDYDNELLYDDALIEHEHGTVSDSDSEVSAPAADVRAVMPAVDFIHRRFVYLSYAFAAFGDRAWEFASIVFIVELFPSTLLYSSVFGLIETVAGMIAGPHIGRYIDNNQRLPVLRASIIGQNATIALASMIFYVALTSGSSDRVITVGGYLLLLACACLIKASSALNKLALHKDWIVTLAGTDREALTSMNAAMRRVDLTASIVSPLLIGVISSVTTSYACIAAIGVWSVASMAIELPLCLFVWHRNIRLHEKDTEDRRRERREAEAAATRQRAHAVLVSVSAEDGEEKRIAEFIHTGDVQRLYNTGDSSDTNRTVASDDDRQHASGTETNNDESSRHADTATAKALRMYVDSPIFEASVAYSILYISVLSFGGIMTSYLSTDAMNVSDALLAVGRAAGAVVGILATLLTPIMIRRFGLVRAGAIAIVSQLLCLVPTVAAFIAVNSLSRSAFLALLFTSLSASRFGLWSFDLIETELMQTGNLLSEAGIINGAQESLMNVAYIGSFLLTIAFSDPSLFIAPAILSFASVLIAAIIYVKWTRSEAARSMIDKELKERLTIPVS